MCNICSLDVWGGQSEPELEVLWRLPSPSTLSFAIMYQRLMMLWWILGSSFLLTLEARSVLFASCIFILFNTCNTVGLNVI